MKNFLKKTDCALSFLIGVAIALAAIQITRGLLLADGELQWAGGILLCVFSTMAYIIFYRNKTMFYGMAIFLMAVPFLVFEFVRMLFF